MSHSDAALQALFYFALVAFYAVRFFLRRQDWADAALSMKASYAGSRDAAFLEQFDPAPWNTWKGREVRECPRLITGPPHLPPFWLLDLEYEDRSGDSVQVRVITVMVMEVVVHRSRQPGRGVAPILREVPYLDSHAVHYNGRYLFLWENSRMWDFAKRLKGSELPTLVRHARYAAGSVRVRFGENASAKDKPPATGMHL